jgi:hypothetical protein
MDSSFRYPVATVSEGSHFGRRHWLLEYGSGSLKAGSKNFKSLALILFALRAKRAAMAGSSPGKSLHARSRPNRA